MDTKKWINFMLNDIENTHKKNIKKIKEKGFKVKEEDKAILFVSEIECEHVWEYQPAEYDVNIPEAMICRYCGENGMLPEPDDDY